MCRVQDLMTLLNLHLAYRRALISVTLNDFDGHFGWLKAL